MEAFLAHFDTLMRDSGCGAKTKSENEAFLHHFQKVKSCESVVNNVQIAFLRIPKNNIDSCDILRPI